MRIYEPRNGDSILLPKTIRDHVLFRERIIKPESRISKSHPKNRSSFTNYSKIKDIFEMNQVKSSSLSKYKAPKISRNTITKLKRNITIKKPKKIILLPKIDPASIEKFLNDNYRAIIEEEKLESDEYCMPCYSKVRTERRIILSKINKQDSDLLNKSLELS